jgi:hypothetical protein
MQATAFGASHSRSIRNVARLFYAVEINRGKREEVLQESYCQS